MSAVLGRRRADDRGAVAASVVIVPVVLTTFLVLIQASLWFYGRTVATAAAQHGLDAARVANGSAADGEATIDEFIGQTGGLDLTTVDVVRTATDADVTVAGDVVQLVPMLPISVSVSLHASVERVVE